MNTPTSGLDPGPADRLITTPQAAQLLAVHISTIRRWIRQGKLPAYRVGDKGVRVRYGDVMELLTPLETSGRADNGSSRPGHLTLEEERLARSAVAGARRLQDEFRLRYGTMTPESWELLNASRDERTAGLSRTTET